MKLAPLTVYVLTDTHYFSKKIGTSGKAYDFDNAKSQKLLADSVEVLSTAFDQLAEDKENDIVLISGDVTNNGELESHEEFIEMLRDLKKRGKRVFILTATHDFRQEGKTHAYRGDERIEIPAATRKMLFDMYREFGPDQAIAVHRQSMSYIVQLCDGYRLFALNDDTNLNNKSGFSDECFEWISERAKEARKDNQFIIAMTHHPLIAPSPIYEIIGKGNMLGDYDKRIEQLADLGIQFIFTGHTHIQDVSAYQSEKGNVIYDICTGSTIGYPAPIRKASFVPDKNKVFLSTDFVRTPESFKKEGKDLHSILEEQLIGVIRNLVKTAGEDIDKLANMVEAISIKPKIIYEFGWIIKPIFKLINSLKIGTVAKWTKKETGLKPADYKDIKDKKVVDLIIELAINLFSGESKYTPDTPTYKITLGFLSILDSVLRILHIDLKKITKVVSSLVELVEPLLCNSKIDSYNAEIPIYGFVESGKFSVVCKETLRKFDLKVKKSKKGLPIIFITVLLLIALLPLILIVLAGGYICNLIRYRDKINT